MNKSNIPMLIQIVASSKMSTFTFLVLTHEPGSFDVRFIPTVAFIWWTVVLFLMRQQSTFGEIRFPANIANVISLT